MILRRDAPRFTREGGAFATAIPGVRHASQPSNRLSFEPIEYGSLRVEASSDESPGGRAAAIERDREFALDEPSVPPIAAADNPAEPVEPRVKVEDVAASPPERIALCRKRS